MPDRRSAISCAANPDRPARPAADAAAGKRTNNHAGPIIMSANDTKRLIKTMLDKGDLLPETEEELRDYLEALKQGPLDKMDESYIRGLARRLGGGGSAPSAAEDEDDEEDEYDDDEADPEDDEDEEIEWEEEDGEDGRLEELQAEAASVHAVLAEAVASIDEARKLLATLYDAEAKTIRDMDPAAAAKTLAEIDAALAAAADGVADDD